jgi:hypothetical protein
MKGNGCALTQVGGKNSPWSTEVAKICLSLGPYEIMACYVTETMRQIAMA